ncbi:MAG: glycoside hydrolase family 70 protein [Streptococcus salivarius]
MVQILRSILTVMIAENVDLFKSWGVTSFEMAHSICICR